MRGVAEMTVLKAGAKLYHGSPANEFTHDFFAATSPSPTHFEHRPMPDTPAWFATNVLFSLHAAARFTPPGQQATFTLHTYTVSKDLNLYSLEDMADFAEFMVGLGEPKPKFNAKAQALPLARLALSSNADGYVVKKDIVRQEPEYVLFGSGLAKLGTPEPFQLRLVPVAGHHPPRSTVHFDQAVLGAPLATYDYTGGPGTLI
ncbi:hypothetical protein [Allorhizocola rhizosphaerae]|uniref:hypothetical protein n=1 Tax=Allorhizocola rhizosphaerae TaxID=1872709 RepID=UPI000E3BC3BA|nr:hypothetical protein [Allorhizocola rhizosphaerae]